MGGNCCAGLEESTEHVEVTPEPFQSRNVLTAEEQRLVKPLLCDIEADFAEFSGDDGKLDVHELAAIWKVCAERKMGTLSAEDIAVIDHTAHVYLSYIDVDRSGLVSYEELAMFMMGGLESRGPLKDMRDHIQKKISGSPEALKEVMQRFKSWDTDGDGFVTAEELAESLVELGGGMKDQMKAQQLASAFLAEADVDSDGKVDLWEVVAHALGRRKTPVELVLYDISNGVSKRFSPLLLGRSFEAIYHSGILVFGQEYWYGGNIFRSKSPVSEVFGPPLESSQTKLKESCYVPGIHTVHLGYTLATMKEWHAHVNLNLAEIFTKENYDVLEHNCNHFSDSGVNFLTGQQIPDAVRLMPQLVMNTPTARLLRPVLNQWLGGFGNSSGASKGLVDQNAKVPEERDAEELVRSLTHGTGTVVYVKGDVTKGTGETTLGADTVASVMKENETTIELRCFDPVSGSIIEKTVNKDQVRKSTRY
eukprot:TRINITY_DN15889_c0_g1_i2.p1 TRINITY_DN15889_c0_g1~~TRINITY_DN15889_c0_g1_i2.p1  ORF type:complete len:478 (-),score=94.88 TRINITY_DN15889_c0_g1_i2:86-1519(-)